MDSMLFQIDQWGMDAMRWSSPWWWVYTGAALFALALLNILPLRVPMMKGDEYGFSDVAKIGLRHVALAALAILMLVFWPLLYALTISSLAADSATGHAWFMNFVKAQAWRWGWLLPLCFVAGLGTRLSFNRYIVPALSRLAQSRLVRQDDHERSDIRQDVGKFKARDFSPREHYRDGEMFLGLDNDGKPTYLNAKIFRETHMQVVGPTRFGKGVLLGVMLEQAVQAGHGVIYIDPKADKFLPYILAEACERVGKKFIYIDLNGEHTRWAPFEGGSERDRRSRIVSCFGLNNAGDAADFYKSKERAILDNILPRCGSSVAGLRAALEQRGDDGKPLKDNASRLYDGLSEFAALPGLNPKKGGGNKIGEAIKAGACVYVRGSLDDPTIKRATQVFLTEVLQEARRLGPERSSHLTLAIDELKFMISQEVSDALATIAGFNVNMVLLHQSIQDLRAPEDRSLNVQALESGVIVNCQVKLMYRATDFDTAEWASKMSGTKMVRVTKSQTVEYNRGGGEAYKAERMLHDLEVPIITPNEMLSLAPRVGVLFVPERLASVVFTCFVPTNTQRELYKKPQPTVGADDKAALPPDDDTPESKRLSAPDAPKPASAPPKPKPPAAPAEPKPTSAPAKPKPSAVPAEPKPASAPPRPKPPAAPAEARPPVAPHKPTPVAEAREPTPVAAPAAAKPVVAAPPANPVAAPPEPKPVAQAEAAEPKPVLAPAAPTPVAAPAAAKPVVAAPPANPVAAPPEPKPVAQAEAAELNPALATAEPKPVAAAALAAHPVAATPEVKTAARAETKPRPPRPEPRPLFSSPKPVAAPPDAKSDAAPKAEATFVTAPDGLTSDAFVGPPAPSAQPRPAQGTTSQSTHP